MKNFRKLIRLIKYNQKARSIAIISAISCIFVIGIIIAVTSVNNKKSTTASASDKSGNDSTYITSSPDSKDITAGPEPVKDKEVTSFKPADKIDLKPGSITVYVNREHALPKEYKPKHLVTPNIRFNLQTYDERTLMCKEAAGAIEKLFAAANKKGLSLVGVSGYRSYARQYEIFTRNLATKGKEHTLKYSAIPGTSEHQTGLVMDCSTESMRYDLSDKFYDTPEGKWLAKNAYKYGFIIRYPKDKAEITGYAYEPWHIRYVGRGLSYYLYENKLTLDEYYKYTPSPNFNFEKEYANILNRPTPRPVYTAPTAIPTVQPTAIPSPTPKVKKTDKKDSKNHKDTNKGDTTDKPVSTPIPAPTSDSDKDPVVTDKPVNSNPTPDSKDKATDSPDSSKGTTNGDQAG